MAKIRFLSAFGVNSLDSYFIGKDFIVVEKVENLDMFSSKPTIKFEINEPKSNLAILIASLKGNDAVYSDNDGYCMLYNVVNITVEPAYYNVPRDHRTVVTVDFLVSDRYTCNNIKEDTSITYVGTDCSTSLTDYLSNITTYGPTNISNGVATCAVTYVNDTVDTVSASNKNESGENAEKLLENLDNKKENKNMRKINNSELKQIVINEKDKVVTAISEYYSIFGIKKEVTLAKCHKDDEFDPYIGAALAIAYQLFGSKTQFHKYVDKEAKNVDKIRTKKEASKEKK